MQLPQTQFHIQVIRNLRVMVSKDLASLYGVTHGALMQAVKRNLVRFPEDFMFQLSNSEWQNLKSQNVISSVPENSWGGTRVAPYAFTEQGVAMLSSVLKSDRAVSVNIEIMRTFVKLRRLISEHQDLTHRLDDLEERYDDQFKVVFEAIGNLMERPTITSRPIGFTADISKDKGNS